VASPTTHMTRPANCPKITVLVCALNEEKNLPYVLPRIPEWVDEAILVDGHSMDDTVEVAKKLCPQIKVLSQPGKGKGDAMRYGIQQASGEIVVTLDADGSTDPREITRFIEPLLNGYDFAKGSRFLDRQPVMPLIRRFGNRLFALLTNLLFGTRYTDLCGGLNGFWRRVALEVDPDGTSFLDEPTLNIRLKKKGFKVTEVTQSDNGRISGVANERFFPQGWRILSIILKERFSG
jgi:glycosyltransferase involved in cell wall biosynthesis